MNYLALETNWIFDVVCLKPYQFHTW